MLTTGDQAIEEEPLKPLNRVSAFVRAYAKLFRNKPYLLDDTFNAMLGAVMLLGPLVGLLVFGSLILSQLNTLLTMQSNSLLLAFIQFFWLLLFATLFLICIYVLTHGLAVVGDYTRRAWEIGTLREQQKDLIRQQRQRELNRFWGGNTEEVKRLKQDIEVAEGQSPIIPTVPPEEES